MKAFKNRILVVLLAFSATFSSCSSDDDAQTAQPNPTFFKAKVAGSSFESVIEEAKGMFHLSDDLVPLLSVQGINGGGDIINITVAEFYWIGTFEISEDPFPNFLGIGSYFVGGEIWGNSSLNEVLKGELIVTEYTPNGRIEGTFHFYVQNVFTEEVMRITDGAFNIPVFTLEN